MKLSQLTSADLQKLAKLIGEREAIAAQLAKIEAQIDAFASGVAVAPRKRGRPAKAKNLINAISSLKSGIKGRRGPKKGEKPGKLKQAILHALDNAGREGLSVGELSDKLKVKTNNLYSWFYTTGRKIAKIKKTSAGKYTYDA
jgi:hypothetical protein